MPSDGPRTNIFSGYAAARVTTDDAARAVTRYALVDLDPRITRLVGERYRRNEVEVPDASWQRASFGLVGVGDVLRVTVWEAGESGVLSGRERRGTEISVRVDVDGTIALPYAGRFPVAGRRAAEIESIIAQRLAGNVIQPQATVIVADSVSSVASVQGEVVKPGPQPLARTNMRVLDLIALAGGAKYPPYELDVRVTRGAGQNSRALNAMLQEIIDNPDTLNVPVSAGDAILVNRRQRKFFAFGSVAQPGEQIFKQVTATLADALGQTWGLDYNRADAQAVYLFRREPMDLAASMGITITAEDRGTIPVVYWINLRDPRSFFLMREFPLRPDDIIYVSTAPLAEMSRFFQILSGVTNTVLIPRTLSGAYPPAR